MSDTHTTLKKQLMAAAVLLAALAVAFGSFLLFRPAPEAGTGAGAALPEPAANAQVVRPDSHRLTNPAKSRVTVVEFLDFECEGCGAFHPVLDRLKKEYGDRVTFVARYFPMPGHRNSGSAARAAEAAARQGRFLAMHDKLFETQREWGEAQTPKDAVFRGFARELGLDMTRYDADVAAPGTAERVAADQRDGLALGVQGTPTFFVQGKKVEPRSYEDLKALIERHLAAP
ncbi:thioredoxin domain-containing protein [Streptomyces sp. NPDC048659]|uniref:DsbA family protein n=1 Tax=Streptomyces sp. NPDC048659 TaxID=3155489 RepID=UPI00342A3B2F